MAQIFIIPPDFCFWFNILSEGGEERNFKDIQLKYFTILIAPVPD